MRRRTFLGLVGLPVAAAATGAAAGCTERISDLLLQDVTVRVDTPLGRSEDGRHTSEEGARGLTQRAAAAILELAGRPTLLPEEVKKTGNTISAAPLPAVVQAVADYAGPLFLTLQGQVRRYDVVDLGEVVIWETHTASFATDAPPGQPSTSPDASQVPPTA